LAAFKQPLKRHVMAGKPKPMSKIKQLIQLHKQGKGIKFIARTLGISKNTVKVYLEKVASSKLDVEAIIRLEDPILEGEFHAGNPAYKKDERYEHFIGKLDYFEKELGRPGVTKMLLWEEYRREYPSGYGHTQFFFHLSQQLVARRPSMVLEHCAGEKLYVDFAGKPLSYIDIQTGEIIYCQVFVACLPYSDYSFAMAVKSQRVEDFLHALSCCLAELGGVPKILVPDNLKSAITKADKYEPDINSALDDFANHYKIAVVPARVRKPKDKALVENQVKLIYTRVYAKLRNQQFFDLASLNSAIREKIREHNQTRMQQKPYCREERFLADERHLLSPLPEHPFELKYYRELKVAKNNHIYLSQDRHYYSVPYPYTGAQVKVIYTHSMVHIYAKGGQIALHTRDYKAGGYTTEKSHLCSHHKHYLDRSPQYYIEKAKGRSEQLCQLVQLIFGQKRHPEQLYRICDGLLSLERKTDPDTFKKACLIAIENQNYSYMFLQNILKNHMAFEQETKQDKPLPEHPNTRGKEHYKQLILNL
jgi:transposase